MSDRCSHAEAIHRVPPSAYRKQACTAAVSLPVFLDAPAGQLGAHPREGFGHVPAQLGPLI